MAVILTALFANSANAADSSYIFAQKPVCKFHYDEQLETRMLSLLQRELTSDGAAYYDAKNPIVTVCHKKAILMFSGTLKPHGKSLLDPPDIFIDVDICTHRVLNVDRDNGTTVTKGSPCE